ncbi:outer membrane lipoprotein carrier protein LolA [Frigidibacter sp. RF13]|uniref:LolA family protein n=1 Tax=Frigidibacter sp. RF13 TaxID=2997340 RepID=UPI00227030CB|nr:outer membrane lipoprotein carrier protein LolA [Frigidibacter sp. RF13]MCY1126636.1 outer membrane lipoprotein carrier protein LolA [Frigidibacter sp. RF13]
MMMRRTLLASALVTLLALPAQAEKLSLDAISAYLNGLTIAEAAFTQINPDGSGAKGKVIIRRPGRMRFEYAKPDKTVVLASSGQVAIFDAKSNQPPEQYPLSKTPLNLILGRKIDLKAARMVVGHAEEGALTIVTAQDPAHPEYGTLALGFSANPVTLRQWVVTDETGGQTTVLLDKLEEGGNYPPSTFLIDAEMRARGLN